MFARYLFSCISAKLDGVKTYMRIRRVPKNIQNKVIKWFDYLWLTQNSSDEEKAIQCLPGNFLFITTSIEWDVLLTGLYAKFSWPYKTFFAVAISVFKALRVI